jgi:hypothetical protein
MTHYTDTNQLIIKVIPLKLHETAHISLGDEVKDKFRGMALPTGTLVPLGTGVCRTPTSSKEGDSSYKPHRCRSGEDDWPTIVIEAGLSESLRRLRADAGWWLDKSGGEVKIVILIKIIRARRSLQIEQLCLQPRTPAAPVTRANALVPTKIQELTIIQNPPIPTPPGNIATYAVTGVPLILEFGKLLLRAPRTA